MCYASRILSTKKKERGIRAHEHRAKKKGLLILYLRGKEEYWHPRHPTQEDVTALGKKKKGSDKDYHTAVVILKGNSLYLFQCSEKKRRDIIKRSGPPPKLPSRKTSKSLPVHNTWEKGDKCRDEAP